MKVTLWRGDIVLNTKTLEVADVQTDNLGGLPRFLIPVRVSCYGGDPNYNVQWRAQDCLKIGGIWSQAWATLTKLRDNGIYPITDPRAGVPAEISLPEVA